MASYYSTSLRHYIKYKGDSSLGIFILTEENMYVTIIDGVGALENIHPYINSGKKIFILNSHCL